jgi:uncharacterized protein YkwD
MMSSCSPRFLEALELRRFLSAVYPTNDEQYLVELVNRGRADPASEAARFGVALNEGLAAGTISTAAKQPLAINPYLTDGARDHSQWMIDTDTFGHTGAGNTDPGQRMSNAGYAFVAPWTWGENIAWRSYNGSATSSLVAQLQKDLFVDAGVTGRGHRTNLMNGALREVGAGYVTGRFQQYNAGMLTQDFAASAGNPFLTGVVYTDTVTKDNFYTPGEGLGGVTITATRLTDNATFSTTSFPSGGYSLRLPGGSYSVVASGAGLSQPITFSSVAIGSQNVKTDFVPGAAGQAPADAKRPTAKLTQALRKRGGSKYYPFVVTYADNVAVNPATFDDADILVTGPGGYARSAVFDGADSTSPGSPRVADYSVKGPGGSWDATDNGLYTITLRAKQVADSSGKTAAAVTLGRFSVIIPAPAATPGVAPTVRPLMQRARRDDLGLFE